VTTHALLIDDDRALAELLGEYLGPHGVRLSHAADGAEGLARLARGGVDVVLLDVMMPGIDGLEVLRRIRARSAVPVLMLTARGDQTDRVVGLELGADDYLPKPVFPRELLARLRAVLRRAAPAVATKVLVVGDLEIDPEARTARVGGEPLPLTSVEFELLRALAERAGRAVPRDTLLDEAGRGDVAVGERAIDVHISRLRAKLAVGDPPRQRIETVRGAGYLLLREPR
jgi:DNA-binding response OmpR family regulator